MIYVCVCLAFGCLNFLSAEGGSNAVQIFAWNGCHLLDISAADSHLNLKAKSEKQYHCEDKPSDNTLTRIIQIPVSCLG